MGMTNGYVFETKLHEITVTSCISNKIGLAASLQREQYVKRIKVLQTLVKK